MDLFQKARDIHKQLTCTQTISGKTCRTDACRKQREDSRFFRGKVQPFVLASRLDDPTLKTETLELAVNFHILCPIIDPKTGKPIERSNRSRIEEYFQFMIDHLTKDFNCLCEEFDNADYKRHRLFSTERNISESNALNNRRIYEQFLSFATRANIRFVIPNMNDCTYEPDWNDFESEKITKIYKAHLRNSLTPDYRDWIDPIVKGYTLDPQTGTYTRRTGFGVPSKNPGRVLDIWAVRFPDHRRGEPSNLEGFGTFPDDPRAGSPVDSVIVDYDVVQWDRSLMPSQLNRYKTLSHEVAHCLGLSHSFEVVGQVADMPADNTVDVGDPFEQNYWPTTNGQPHAIMNFMGYQSDERMQFFTHDQVIKMRQTLRNERRGWLNRIVPTSDELGQAPSFRHRPATYYVRDNNNNNNKNNSNIPTPRTPQQLMGAYYRLNKQPQVSRFVNSWTSFWSQLFQRRWCSKESC